MERVHVPCIAALDEKLKGAVPQEGVLDMNLLNYADLLGILGHV